MSEADWRRIVWVLLCAVCYLLGHGSRPLRVDVFPACSWCDNWGGYRVDEECKRCHRMHKDRPEDW